MSFGGAVGAGAIVASFAGGIGKTVEFEDALGRLQAVSGATTKDMLMLKDAAIDAGIATQFNPTEAADALTDLASAGYNAKDAFALLRPTLDLAAGSLGQLSPSDAAGLASQAMKAFSIDTKDAALTVDKLIQATNVFSIQAKDLPLGLANASRGAIAMNQSLDETLVAFGMVRNVIPRVESAATAVSVAMERMVDPKVQTALKGLGVTAVDSAGKFRPFLDVVGDMLPELNKMTEAKRSAFLQDTFGTEALAGFNAIMSQATKGIQTNTGETLKGADAIKYLRDQIANSKGTAENFAESLRKTLGGQLRLLTGSISTFAIVGGEAIGKMLVPVVKTLTNGLNYVLKAMRSVSEETRMMAAKWALLAGLVASLFLVLGSGAAPIVAALALVGLAFAGIRVAFEQNIGGLADKFEFVVSKAKLIWAGLSQAFSQGGFSGAVQEELGRAENAGLKQFVINVYGLAMRVQEFLSNAKASFTSFVETMGPSFERVSESFGRLMVALGLGSNTAQSSTRSWNAWGEAGSRVGKVLGVAFDLVVRGVAIASETAEGFMTKWDEIKRSTDGVVAPLKNAGAALEDVGIKLGIIDPSGATSSWQTFGKILGFVVNFGMQQLGRLAKHFAAAIEIISGIIQTVGAVLRGDWSAVWDGLHKTVIAVVKGILLTMGEMVAGMARAIDAVGALAGKDLGAESKVRSYFDALTEKNDGILTGGKNVSEGQTLRTGSDLIDTQAALVASQRAASDPAVQDLNAKLADLDKMSNKPLEFSNHTVLMVDGDVLAEAVEKRRNDGRGPVTPVGSE